MTMIFTRTFWNGVFERAFKTFAQVLASTLTVGVGILDWDVKSALSITATAVLLSVLTSIGDARRTDTAIATAEPPHTPTHVAG